MTDFEYDLLDELYFVIRFRDLKQALNWSEPLLLAQLTLLLQKNWVKCLDLQDHILAFPPEDLAQYYNDCLFLATKEGLQAHNSK